MRFFIVDTDTATDAAIAQIKFERDVVRQRIEVLKRTGRYIEQISAMERTVLRLGGTLRRLCLSRRTTEAKMWCDTYLRETYPNGFRNQELTKIPQCKVDTIEMSTMYTFKDGSTIVVSPCAAGSSISHHAPCQ